MTQQSRLRINAVVNEIERACAFVSINAREAGMDDESIYRCYLSVEEICTNIIEHGYHFEGQGRSIEIVCRRDERWFTIIVIDDAPAFNPLQQEDPDPKAPLMQRPSGGWGIYFVKKFMDRIEYRYCQQRNCLIISKRL